MTGPTNENPLLNKPTHIQRVLSFAAETPQRFVELGNVTGVWKKTFQVYPENIWNNLARGFPGRQHSLSGADPASCSSTKTPQQSSVGNEDLADPLRKISLEEKKSKDLERVLQAFIITHNPPNPNESDNRIMAESINNIFKASPFKDIKELGENWFKSDSNQFSPSSLISLAIQKNNLAALRALIKLEGGIQKSTKIGAALESAVQNNNLEALQVILEIIGTDVSIEDCIKLIIYFSDDQKNIKRSQALLAGADINQSSNGVSEQIFLWVIQNQNLDNEVSKQLFLWAIQNQSLEVAQMILKHNNGKNQAFLDMQDKSENPMLFLAVNQTGLKMFTFLLEAGASVNIPVQKWGDAETTTAPQVLAQNHNYVTVLSLCTDFPQLCGELTSVFLEYIKNPRISPDIAFEFAKMTVSSSTEEQTKNCKTNTKKALTAFCSREDVSQEMAKSFAKSEDLRTLIDQIFLKISLNSSNSVAKIKAMSRGIKQGEAILKIVFLKESSTRSEEISLTEKVDLLLLFEESLSRDIHLRRFAVENQEALKLESNLLTTIKAAIKNDYIREHLSKQDDTANETTPA